MFSPSGRDGDEGRWSSFSVALGTPAQNIRMLISTSNSASWAVLPPRDSVCQREKCNDEEGTVFEPRNSSSWRRSGSDTYENNTCVVGTDDLRIGSAGNASGPILRAQTIVGCQTAIPSSIGMLGLSPFFAGNSTNSSSLRGILQSLRSSNLIPSMSYSYTAGASYRNAPGSLVLGGVDKSRSEPDRVSFSLNSNSDERMVVGIQSITTNRGGISTATLSHPAISANIDSTVIDMSLPREVCDVVESHFKLSYEEKLDMYFVNDSVHEELLQTQPSVTVTIGDKAIGGKTVNITIPYAAFDLGTSPLPRGTMRRFPLRRAQNGSLPTLGRVFLQEAYLTVDWEHGIFSISRARFDSLEKVVPIQPSAVDPMIHTPKMTMTPPTTSSAVLPSQTVPVRPSTVVRHSGGITAPTSFSNPTPTPFNPPSLSKGAIAGAVLGPTGALAALICLLICLRRRTNRTTNRISRPIQRISSSSTLTSMIKPLPREPRPRGSLPTTRTISGPELLIASSGFTAEPAEEAIPDAKIQDLDEKNNLEGPVNRVATMPPPPPLEEHPLFRSRPASPLLPPCSKPHPPPINLTPCSRLVETERSSTLSTITELPSPSVYTVFSEDDCPDPAHLQTQSSSQCMPLDTTRRRTFVSPTRDSSEYWDRFFSPETRAKGMWRGAESIPYSNKEVSV